MHVFTSEMECRNVHSWKITHIEDSTLLDFKWKSYVIQFQRNTRFTSLKETSSRSKQNLKHGHIAHSDSAQTMVTISETFYCLTNILLKAHRN